MPSYKQGTLSILDKRIPVIPFTGEPDNERYRSHYGWLHIIYNESIAQQVDIHSDEFKLAVLWYYNYSYIYGNKNKYIDYLISENIVETRNIKRRDYDLHYRDFLIKGLRWFKWV